MYFYTNYNDLFKQIEYEWSKLEGHLPSVITRTEDKMKWKIRMAVSGFKKSDLSVFVKDNILHLAGNINKGEFFDDGEIRVSGNLALRNFEQRFSLSEHMEVTNVSLKDGILTVSLEMRLPEEKKPKTFAIE